MEEEKAAAYYDELTRKGGGAARFKQGLGFSAAADTNTNDGSPHRGSALPSSSSSFLSNFVKASSITNSESISNSLELQKQSQVQKIQNKLKKKEPSATACEFSEKIKGRERGNAQEGDGEREKEWKRDWDSKRDKYSRRRIDRNVGRETQRHSGRGSRSRERDKYREDIRRRSRSRSVSSDEERRYRNSSRDRRRDRDKRRRTRSRSFSDEERRPSRDKRSSRSRSLSAKDRKGKGAGGNVAKRERKGGTDFARLIEGYDKMTPAERVKAKMKLQLSETAEKDAKVGCGAGWERFDFDKDAPLEDEEIEAADDDAAIVKRIGQTFRFSTMESKREDAIKAAHDEAIFGAPVCPPSMTSVSELVSEKEEDEQTPAALTLMSEKVLAKQKGSWRDRALGMDLTRGNILELTYDGDTRD